MSQAQMVVQLFAGLAVGCRLAVGCEFADLPWTVSRVEWGTSSQGPCNQSCNMAGLISHLPLLLLRPWNTVVSCFLAAGDHTF